MAKKDFGWLNNANMTTWWFSWDDLKYPAPEIITKWERRADIYKSIGANAVTTFGIHFRWDWLNYFDRYDAMLRKVVEICHVRGIKVIDHHSNQLTHHIRNEKDREHIVINQDHHLPLFPDSWDNQIINGKRLSDWRIISAKTDKPAYLPGYNAEALCQNNPDYLQEYYAYAARLVKNTGIDGVMSDDTAFHPDIYSCSCRYCREMFKQRTGKEIPSVEDTGFWNNYSDSLFQEWIQMHYDSVDAFYCNLRKALPDNVAMWGCCCGDVMPYKVRQGCSMEMWIKHMDAVFVEMYYGLDMEKDEARIISELAVASSLGDYNGKPALIICYSDTPAVFEKWATLFEQFGVRPWYCRLVRKVPEIYEDVILKDGYPEVKTDAAVPYGCGIVYSRKLKDLFGEHDDSYYQAFAVIVEKVFASGIRPQIIFDDFKPAAFLYENIYAPMHDKICDDMKKYLSATGLNIKTC
jgi:hypothetical protein